MLVFRHLLAGSQIGKGTVEPDESLKAAVIREMVEESGVAVTVKRDLSSLFHDHVNQIWHLFEGVSKPLSDCWEHWTKDDGGHVFRFYWHRLDEIPNQEWHPTFVRIPAFIARKVSTT